MTLPVTVTVRGLLPQPHEVTNSNTNQANCASRRDRMRIMEKLKVY
jgi:hypothetical protein